MQKGRDRTPKENELQSAIMGSLSAYCGSVGVHCKAISYYANQQGGDINKVCADFSLTLDNKKLFLAEVKVMEDRKLTAFSQDQFNENLRFEQAGFPIYYIYNKVKVVSYLVNPPVDNYAILTLSETNCSRPSQLPGITPNSSGHSDLFKWLFEADDSGGGGNSIIWIATIFAAIRSGVMLTNGLIMLMYGVNGVRWLDQPDKKKLDLLVRTISEGVRGKFLSKGQVALLVNFLHAESEAYKAWMKFQHQQMLGQAIISPLPNIDTFGGSDPSDPSDPSGPSGKRKGPSFSP